MTTRHKQIVAFVSVLIAIAVWSLALFFINPDEVINRLGVQNSYIALFLIALVGGVSSLSVSSFYATVYTFAAGGLNPIFLALVAAPALFVGDTIFYYLGFRGKKVIEGRFEKLIHKMSVWLVKKPDWLIKLVIFIYAGLTPLPGDILMISLAVLGYPYKKAWWPVLLGNYTIILLIGLVANFFPDLFSNN